MFRERGKDGERERQRNISVIETLIGCLLSMPQPGIKPATQAWALTGNQTSNLLLHGMIPSQLSHTSHGLI